MQEFDFTIEHRAGAHMQHVDALSRNPIKINAITTTDWIHAVQSQNHDIQLIKEQINRGKSENCFVLVDDKVCRLVDGKLKIMIPRDMRWRIVKMFHDDNGHPGFTRTLAAIQDTYWFGDMRKFSKKFVEHCIPCMTSKKPTGKRRAKLYPIEKVAEPFYTSSSSGAIL